MSGYHRPAAGLTSPIRMGVPPGARAVNAQGELPKTERTSPGSTPGLVRWETRHFVRAKPIKFRIDENGCHICISHKTKPGGYPAARINKKRWRLHRYVYTVTKGEIKKGMLVRHTCDVRICINPEHVIIGTLADNVADCVSRGRIARGVMLPIAKLKDDDVRVIRSSTLTGVELAKMFGVSQATISLIRSKKNWKHVT